MVTTYNEGYYEQTSIAQADALTALLRIGKPINGKPIVTWGRMEQVVEQDHISQYYPDLDAGNQVIDTVNLNFFPINGRFLYWILGKRSASTGTRTISTMDGTSGGLGDTGFKPRLSFWKETSTDKHHVFGAVIGSMAMQWDNSSGALQVSLQGVGMSHGSDSYTPSLSYEDDVDTLYTNTTSMTWDGDELNPIIAKMNVNNPLGANMGYTGYIDNIVEFTTQNTEINITCEATNGAALIADYNSSAAKTFTWSIAKAADATKTIVITAANARIKQILIAEELGLPPVYTFKILTENLSCAVADGV